MTTVAQFRAISDLEAEKCILAIQDGNHGGSHPKASEYEAEGIPFVMASDIHDGRIDLEGATRIPKSRTDKLRIGFALPGDVLITHKGTVGEVAIVPSVQDYVMLTPQVTYYRTDNKKLDARFLAFVFRSPHFQSQLLNISAQSTRPYVSISTQRHLIVPWYDTGTQRRIASILGAYDDLIEVNRRRIAVLEEMTRRLFDEWFLHFRFPGHEGQTTIETERGRLPTGWSYGAFRQVSDILSGFAFKSATFDEGGQYKLVTIKNIHDGRFNPICDSRINDVPGNMPRHCILLEGDICMSLTGNVGRVCVIYGEGHLLNQRVAKMSPKFQEAYAYTYMLARSELFQKRLIQISNGVAQQNLSPIQAANLTILVPDREQIYRFSKSVGPMLSGIINANKTTSALSQQRDLLLPRLISGDLSVSADERKLEAAA